jgi:hypothetical protein
MLTFDEKEWTENFPVPDVGQGSGILVASGDVLGIASVIIKFTQSVSHLTMSAKEARELAQSLTQMANYLEQ